MWWVNGKNCDYQSDEQRNKQTDEQSDTSDMPDLQRKESYAQGNNQTALQSATSIKILTSNQMPSQFATLLAQLQAGKKSQKSRNKNWNGRLCSFLYRSKEVTKKYTIILWRP